MTDANPTNPGLLNWLLILLLGIIWGAAFLSVRVALDGFGPWTVAALRTSIAAVILCSIGTLMGQGIEKIKSPSQWIFCLVIGTGAIALPFVLLSLGQQVVPSAFAGVAMGAVPLLVLPLVAIFSPEEGIGPRRIIGMGLGFVGVIILVGPGAIKTAGEPFETLGRMACLSAAACYAAGSVLTRRAPAMPPIAFASATMVVAAAIVLPLALYLEGLPNQFPPIPSLALLFAALGPTALAAVIRVRVITTAGSVFMSLTSYMVPVWSVILGIIILNEQLSSTLFFALALILLGIAISQSRSLLGMFRRA
ncbi:MAG: DMT family transporter [Pseudomonadota bacterium]